MHPSTALNASATAVSGAAVSGELSARDDAALTLQTFDYNGNARNTPVANISVELFGN